jgi:predicted TIM-barrel fold metal-dependent hydrolase
MLIDVHAHFFPPFGLRADWREYNAARLRAGERIGITIHVTSTLGSFGRTSPTYFPSPDDIAAGNDFTLALQRDHPDRVRGYVCVNPNFAGHALGEIERGRGAGLIGIKLAASRRANEALLDPICQAAGERGLPILHHIWQGRRRDWPGQEASDGAELCQLAKRHPSVSFILAHIGGGGDWRHTLAVVRPHRNVYIDLSGSGVDGGMLEACLVVAGSDRLLWGSDISMDTGWAKLRYLERTIPPADVELLTWRNAVRIFPSRSLASD